MFNGHLSIIEEEEEHDAHIQTTQTQQTKGRSAGRHDTLVPTISCYSSTNRRQSLFHRGLSRREPPSSQIFTTSQTRSTSSLASNRPTTDDYQPRTSLQDAEVTLHAQPGVGIGSSSINSTGLIAREPALSSCGEDHNHGTRRVRRYKRPDVSPSLDGEATERRLQDSDQAQEASIFESFPPAIGLPQESESPSPVSGCQVS